MSMGTATMSDPGLVARKKVLIAAAIVAVVPIPSLFQLYDVISAPQSQSGNVKLALVALFNSIILGIPVAMLASRIALQQSLSGAYWFLPVYFGAMAVTQLTLLLRVWIVGTENYGKGSYARIAIFTLVYAILAFALHSMRPETADGELTMTQAT